MWTTIPGNNWKLAERFLCNESCKKDLCGILFEGKRSYLVRTYAPERGFRGQGRLHGWRPSLESQWFESHIGCAGLEVWQGGQIPTSWKPVWLTEGLWKDDFTCEEHIHLLIPEEGQRRLVENCITGRPVFHDPMICAPPESNECSRTDKPRILIRI